MLVWAIGYFARSLPARGSRLALVLEKLTFVSLFWLEYLDRWLVGHAGASDGASGVYFMGRQADAPIPDKEILATYCGTVGTSLRRGA
jgi:hypothetical protein